MAEQAGSFVEGRLPAGLDASVRGLAARLFEARRWGQVGRTSDTRIAPSGARTCMMSKSRVASARSRSSIASSACTAVVGSLTAGATALSAMSASTRRANAGSCSKVRSSPTLSALNTLLDDSSMVAGHGHHGAFCDPVARPDLEPHHRPRALGCTQDPRNVDHLQDRGPAGPRDLRPGAVMPRQRVVGRLERASRVRVQAVDHFAAPALDLCQRRCKLDRRKRGHLEAPVHDYRYERSGKRDDEHRSRRLRSPRDHESVRERIDHHRGKQRERAPHHRRLPKQIQTRRERGRAELDDEEQQREHDPDERDRARADGEQHLGGARSRDVESNMHLRSHERRQHSQEGGDQLHDAGAQATPAAQHTRKLMPWSLRSEGRLADCASRRAHPTQLFGAPDLTQSPRPTSRLSPASPIRHGYRGRWP